MGYIVAAPVVLMIVFDVIGPSIVLLYTKRRSGSWPRAIRNSLVTATAIEFFVTGFVGALYAVVNGLLSPPSDHYHYEHDPAFCFIYFAMYGAGFAGMGYIYCLPLIGLWRLVHRRSFASVTRSGIAWTPHAD